ncbi:MAG: hypothetical protein JW772_00150 [Candidatus Diapherotrites archaeon]|nr:hypothetical protein [Candidatus Diapherotrites archaeon]
MPRLKVSIGEIPLFAQANNANPQTLEAVLKHLPIEGEANLWGQEAYFYIGFDIAQENAKKEPLVLGEIAFWPEGSRIVIFWGKTPMSTESNSVAYFPVNVFAQLEKVEKEKLDAIPENERIKIGLAE